MSVKVPPRSIQKSHCPRVATVIPFLFQSNDSHAAAPVLKLFHRRWRGYSIAAASGLDDDCTDYCLSNRTNARELRPRRCGVPGARRALSGFVRPASADLGSAYPGGEGREWPDGAEPGGGH